MSPGSLSSISAQDLADARLLMAGGNAGLEGVAAGRGLVIAIPFNHTGGWSAQTSFLRSLAVCLHRAAQAQQGQVIVLNMSGPAGARAVADDLRKLMVPVDPAIWYGDGGPGKVLETLGAHCLVSLFEVPPVSMQNAGTGVVGWIPDFQHFRLPRFFDEAEIRTRDEAFHAIISRSDFILMSSRDVERDCVAFDPASAGKTRVHPFPSGLVMEKLSEVDPAKVLAHYHLPEKFALVANQFWAHKNHATVIEAVRQAADAGCRVPVVLTGLPADSRDPANRVVSQVLQDIAKAGLRDTIFPLGQVPYQDLVALMKAAAVIIQPSCFEGWSTIVQDAKALGRPVICSALGVHREQAPEALGFFDPGKPEELAGILTSTWPGLPAGPDPAGLDVAMHRQKDFARDYGAALWLTCVEAASHSGAWPKKRSTSPFV